MADTATLGITVKFDSVQEAREALDQLGDSAGHAERGAGKFGNSAERAASQTGILSGALGKLAAAFGVAFSVSAINSAADAWSDMQSRVGAAVKSMEDAPVIMRRLLDMANASYSPLEQTVEIYGRNVAVLGALGKSSNEAADFTEALNHALVTTATRGERAASVQNALSKAMAVGRLQADGLETVLAHGGRVAEALADELGTTVNGLRQMATDGKITGEVIANSLIKRLEELRDEAGEMPATMSDAATAISNVFTYLVGTVDQALGASEGLAMSIYDAAIGLARYADTIAQVFVTAQIAMQSAYEWIKEQFNSIVGDVETGGALMAVGIGLATTAVVGLAAAILGPLMAAMAAITAAILANPIGLIIGSISAAIAAAFIFRDEMAQIFGFDLIEAARSGANFVIGVFAGAYNALVAVWDNLPAAIEYTSKSAFNRALEAMVWLVEQWQGLMDMIPDILRAAWENFPIVVGNAARAAAKAAADAAAWMVNQAIKLINAMISGVAWLLEKVGIEVQTISEVDFSGGLDMIPEVARVAGDSIKDFLTNNMLELSDEATNAGNAIRGAFDESLSVDYIGATTNSLGEMWRQAGEVTAQVDALNASLGDGGGALGAAGDAAGEGGSGKGGGGKEGREGKGLRNQLERRLEALKEHFATEQELLQQEYQKNLETLELARQAEMLSQQEYNNYKLMVEKDFQDQMRALRAQEYADALNATGDLFGAMAQLTSSGNERLLKMQKIAGAAAALVSTFVGAAKALELPFPANLAAVATVLAKGMSLVAAIRSGNKSAGSAGGGGGSYTPPAQSAAPTQPEVKPMQAVELKMHGEVFTRETVADLIDKINDMGKDGYNIVVRTA